MRKILISADMEGCAGVSAPQALLPDRWAWEWSAARKWMTAEVKAAAEAALVAGFEEVIVADSHGIAHNIDPDELPENVRLIRSWPRPLLQMQGIEDPDVTACVFIGYHAGAHARGSILAHTYSGFAYRSVKMNGVPCSEGYLNAALAGEFGKPVLFISGDQHTVDDARRYAPKAVGFVTKHAIGWRSQMSLPPHQIARGLKEAVSQALRNPLSQPFTLTAPFCLELEMASQAAAEMLAYLPQVDRKDAVTISVVFDRLSAAMQFIAFAMLYTPSGVPF